MSCTPRPATSKGPLTSDGLGGLGAQIAPEDYLQNRGLWLTFRNEKGIISRGKREPSWLHCSAPCLRPPPPDGQQGRGAVTKPCQTSRDEQLGRLVLPGLKPAMGHPPPPGCGTDTSKWPDGDDKAGTRAQRHRPLAVGSRTLGGTERVTPAGPLQFPWEPQRGRRRRPRGDALVLPSFTLTRPHSIPATNQVSGSDTHCPGGGSVPQDWPRATCRGKSWVPRSPVLLSSLTTNRGPHGPLHGFSLRLEQPTAQGKTNALPSGVMQA